MENILKIEDGKDFSFHKKQRNPWFLLFLLLLPFFVNAQSVDSGKSGMSFPWAGGINSAQFGTMDLNGDGIADLVVFDRQGNRLMCFVNKGIAGKIDYTYAPQYASLFPHLYDWAEFVDYDNDGKTDIFSYSPGWAGIVVYKNVTVDYLKFKRVVYPYLTSYQGGGYTNIFVTYADYPAISDLDGDGDLDILSFWGLGSFVEMHKNLSMEKYGTADSLDFEKTEYCWGHFAESDESNALFLDTCIGSRQGDDFLKDRHTGSTFLMMDLNNSGVKDLLLGDVDFPGLYALTNDGTVESAHIDAFDTLFPDYDTTVHLFSMPVAASIDVNNDGKKDLIISPFDPSPYVSQNRHSVWLYLNEGANNNPHFHLKTKSFLQNNMIDAGSGAYPLFVDWDGDGLTDILLGNYGFYVKSYYENFTLHSVYDAHLQFYKNRGTATKPAFQLWNNNMAGLDFESLLGIYPAVADLDGDGDNDLLVGNATGKLIFIKNNAGSLSIISKNYANIDVGEYSTPQLFDLDKDGLKDLIIGEKAGNLNYYHNDGTTTSPNFNFVTDSLGKINVTDFSVSYDGYSTPCFYRKASGETLLVVGSEQGKLFYYHTIDGNLSGTFSEDSVGLNTLLDTVGVSWNRGMRTAATLADVDGDGKPEMVVGNFSGGLEFFKNRPDVLPLVNKKRAPRQAAFTIAPNPSKNRFSIILKVVNKGGLQYVVYNRVGSKISTRSLAVGTHNMVVNTNTWPAGIYFVRLTIHGREIGTKKVIVNH